MSTKSSDKVMLVSTALSFFMPGWKTAQCNLDDEGVLDMNKVGQYLGWLQTEHYLTLSTLTSEQYAKLKKAEKALCFKVSDVLGGLWAAYCIKHRDNVVDFVPRGSQEHDLAEAWADYETEVQKYKRELDEFHRLEDIQKQYRALKRGVGKNHDEKYVRAVMKDRGFNRPSEFTCELPPRPTPPVAPERELKKVTRKQQTLTITLIDVVETQVKQKITKGVKKGKYKYNTVITRTPVKTIMIPADPNWNKAELNGAIEALVARLRPDPRTPRFTTYEFTLS